MPAGSEVKMGMGASYLFEKTLTLTEKRDLKIDWQSSTITRKSRADDAGLMYDFVQCLDIEWFGAKFSGANANMEQGAHTPRESHHIGKSSGSKNVCIYDVEHDHPFGDAFYFGIRDVGGPKETAYIWSENVWLSGFYFHDAGRQLVTVQGARDCGLIGGEMERANRSGVDMESYSFPADSDWPGLEKNGVDGFTVDGTVIGQTRLNMLANAGSGQADNVTLRGVRVARAPSIFGDIGRGARRKNWRIEGMRLLAPGEARHVAAPDPAKPPHSGSTGGAAFSFTGYDGVHVIGNGPVFLDASRQMSLVKATNCTGLEVHSNDVRHVFGGDSARQWEPKGPGVELRVLP